MKEKTIPVNSDSPEDDTQFRKEEKDILQKDVQKKSKIRWHFAGTSVAGTKHFDKDIPCQDSFQYKLLPGGEVAIVVSDGAGSVGKADEGSAFIVQNAIQFLEESLNLHTPASESEWQYLVRLIYRKTRDALVQNALNSETPLKEYSATMILAVLADEWTIGGSIGDCAAVALKEAGGLFSLCPPQKGEYANVTNFLTQENALDKLDIQIYQETSDGVAVISDGLLELALNITQNKPYSPFFNPLFDFTSSVEDTKEAERQLSTFLNSKRVNARTDDDKTLVLAIKVIS